MTSEQAKKVKEGDNLFMKDFSDTPNRKFELPVKFNEPVPFAVLHIKTDSGGFPHSDIGMKLPKNASPLLSRDTGEEIDGTDTYWLHPSRFDK